MVYCSRRATHDGYLARSLILSRTRTSPRILIRGPCCSLSLFYSESPGDRACTLRKTFFHKLRVRSVTFEYWMSRSTNVNKCKTRKMIREQQHFAFISTCRSVFLQLSQSVVGPATLAMRKNVLLTTYVFVLTRSTDDAISCSSPTQSLHFSHEEVQIIIPAQLSQMSWFGVKRTARLKYKRKPHSESDT